MKIQFNQRMHVPSLLVILCTSLVLVHALRVENVSNQNVVFQSKRIVRRDLRAPPVQHVYPRAGKARQFQAQHQSIQTIKTTTKPQQNCDCTQIFEPVCGSNGKTFTNVCFFNCAAVGEASLRVVSNGICRTVEQINVGSRLNTNNNRRQQSQSHVDCTCPEIYNPICGSNEQTYPNVCAITCEKRKQPSVRLRIMHRGECNARRMPSTIRPSVNI